ncbi:MAG: hypothetical protein SOT80_03805, partial [Candidatus Pseudoruminococcus sp.]|nr:hypothetical protein [Candidatus Pseudoruminococcus sp.]
YKDIRIFVNTISKAIDTMKSSGIDAISEKNETDDYIEYCVRIPKTAIPQTTTEADTSNVEEGEIIPILQNA